MDTDVELHRVDLRDGEAPAVQVLREELQAAPQDRIAVGVGGGEVILGATAQTLASVTVAEILAAPASSLLSFTAVGAETSPVDPGSDLVVTIAIADDGSAIAAGRDGRVFHRAAVCVQGESRFSAYPEPAVRDTVALIVDPLNPARVYALDTDRRVQVIDTQNDTAETLPLVGGVETLFMGYVGTGATPMASNSTSRWTLAKPLVPVSASKRVVAVGGDFIGAVDGSVTHPTIRIDIGQDGPAGTNAVGASTVDGIVLAGAAVNGGWFVRRCAVPSVGGSLGGCITRQSDAVLGVPKGAALLGDVLRGALIVTHSAGIASFADGLNLSRSVPIGNLGDRISLPLPLDADCTVFAMASFFGGSTGDANHLHRLTATGVQIASADRASGSITALARGPNDAVWGIGKSGVLFELGDAADIERACSLVRPVARGVARTLNDFHASLVDGNGFLLTTSFGELVRLPQVQ